MPKGLTDWQFVILAGGLGTRLYPLTEKIPKPIVEVAGKPYLEWQLLELKALGAKKVLLLTGHLGEQIEAAFGNGQRLGLEIQYSRENSPLGTGGALQLALPLLEDQFVLLNGDSFLPMDFSRLVGNEIPDLSAVIVGFTNHPATPVPNNLKVDAGRVTAYRKNAGLENGFQCVDAGVYLLRKSVLLGTSSDVPSLRSCVGSTLVSMDEMAAFSLESLWEPLIRQKQLGVHMVSQRFFDIGTPERLKEFEEFVHDHFQNAVSGQFHGRGHGPS
ncbi:MAG: NTP transferase domain-containing protein [Bdellovibrionales bacterium]|nr:NTP transferase domain-containing protein [Bdellovibrionales bacterium]